MPTSAKLVAAIWFGLIGWVAANAFSPMLGEGAGGTGTFKSVSAVIGMLCGWFVMGNDVGRTMADAISGGLKTSIIMAFFALLIFSGRQMIDDAFRMRYDGPMEAMLGWFTKMMENGQDMASVGVIGALTVGGIMEDLLCEWAWRRWQ